MNGSGFADARTRVRALVDGAKRIADASSELGRRARSELVRTTGLSREGVELALAESLETQVDEREMAGFCANVEPVSRAHVLLSANVFVAAHRAVALALAASARVFVRSSRREPVFVRFLAEAAPGLFEIVSELAPESGDAVFAYGADETLDAVRAKLPPGVVYHPHGAGIGVAIVERTHATRDAARALALDVALFDQRGCLSPRALVFSGSDAEARAFAELVAAELAALALRVPLGSLDPDEAADITTFRDAATYVGSALAAGPGWVVLAPRDAFAVAPVGRCLLVVPSDDPVTLLVPHALWVAALGVATSSAVEHELARSLPGARQSALGRMQRPPFDGPVDRRPHSENSPPRR